jgi:excisionase family DNA binding protein
MVLEPYNMVPKPKLARLREVVNKKMEPLHDIKSAARQLSLSTWGVRYLISRGRLRPVRIGRLVRLEDEELRRFVSECRSSHAAHLPTVTNTETQNG